MILLKVIQNIILFCLVSTSYFSIAPDDYNPVSDVQLTFSPGQTTQTFNVNILDDNVLEYTERLFVAAMTDDSSVTVAPDQANITILDNDGTNQL